MNCGSKHWPLGHRIDGHSKAHLEVLSHRALACLSCNRGNKKSPNYRFAPGFIRIEPEAGRDEELPGIDGEWYEWEVILSRYHHVRSHSSVCPSGVEKLEEDSIILASRIKRAPSWASVASTSLCLIGEFSDSADPHTRGDLVDVASDPARAFALYRSTR